MSCCLRRIHREGQKRQCVIYRLLTAGTMDEKIYQRQVSKLGLTSSVMKKGGSGGGGAEEMGAGGGKGKGGGDSFTLDELKKVFQLHPNVACQTHDALGCRCVFGEPQAGQHNALEAGAAAGEGADELPSSSWQEDEKATDKPYGTFTQASQMPDGPVEVSLILQTLKGNDAD